MSLRGKSKHAGVVGVSTVATELLARIVSTDKEFMLLVNEVDAQGRDMHRDNVLDNGCSARGDSTFPEDLQ